MFFVKFLDFWCYEDGFNAKIQQQIANSFVGVICLNETGLTSLFVFSIIDSCI